MADEDPTPSAAMLDAAMVQLEEVQRELDYDTKEFTVELLVNKFGNGGEGDDIFVPHYQRRFNWEPRRQSRLIESLLIGLPVPFLFFADCQDGRLEVVDGRQRLGTCKAFLANDLELTGLERLEKLNGFTFKMLSKSQQRRFRNRTIRSVVLSQKVTEEDRRDLFDRINTGSLLAEPAETRRGSNAGPVTELIDELAMDSRFQRICPLPPAARKLREGEELITRFFALSGSLDGYRDRIGDFLNTWLKNINTRATSDAALVPDLRSRFHRTMMFAESRYPNGFAKKATSTTTPRVRFDALAIGAYLAMEEDPSLEQTGPKVPISDWFPSDDFFVHTTSSSANVRSRIENRTTYVKLMLLGKIKEAIEAELMQDPAKKEPGK